MDFEGNFTGTGTPTIEICLVNKDGTYTSKHTADMVATPVTGKYSYRWTGGDVLLNYSARMTLGTETLNGVYNGLFTQILQKNSFGGGGGGGLTEDQIKYLIKQTKEALEEGFEKLLPKIVSSDAKEVLKKAIQDIKKVGESAIKDIAKKTKVEIKDNSKDINKIVTEIKEYLQGKENKTLDELKTLKQSAESILKTQVDTKYLKEIKTSVSDAKEEISGILGELNKAIIIHDKKAKYNTAILIDEINKPLK